MAIALISACSVSVGMVIDAKSTTARWAGGDDAIDQLLRERCLGMALCWLCAGSAGSLFPGSSSRSRTGEAKPQASQAQTKSKC